MKRVAIELDKLCERARQTETKIHRKKQIEKEIHRQLSRKANRHSGKRADRYAE